MKYQLIAQNQKGDGMLPMKQSKEIEDKKSEIQKSVELCNFIKNAFVVDGNVSLVRLKQPIKIKEVFIVEDGERGNFIVALKN